jgi:hypothetical protein
MEMILYLNILSDDHNSHPKKLILRAQGNGRVVVKVDGESREIRVRLEDMLKAIEVLDKVK